MASAWQYTPLATAPTGLSWRRLPAWRNLPLSAPQAKAPLEHRIEHVQLIHPEDAPRLAKLGVIASMQPLHATSDMDMADQFWGERSSDAYAWNSLLAHGTVLAFGSDAPVETPNPFAGLYAAVTRRRADGSPSPGLVSSAAHFTLAGISSLYPGSRSSRRGRKALR